MGCWASVPNESTAHHSRVSKPNAIIDLKNDEMDMDKNRKWLANPRISLAKQSMLVCQLLLNHKQGKSIHLAPIQKQYTEISKDGTFIWDLDRMKTDFSEWDGCSGYDGLEEDSPDRDEIGLIILKALIANGTCVNTVTTHGRTALQITALAGDLEYCKELIENGADVNATNETGETALCLVKQWNNRPKDLSHIITYLESFDSQREI